jgi:hypothetical protein
MHRWDSTMKMRLLKMSPEFLIERLRGQLSSTTSNLPANAELLDIKYDPFTRQVLAIVRSENFEEIKETYPIPEFPLTLLAAPQKPPMIISPLAHTNEPKVARETKPKNETAPPKSTQGLPKRETSMIEEEFSQEQRKLLSFSIDENFVIVKPVRFLKAEWEDINEIARSLGGRWVKGDIISYWEIPIPQN